MAMAMQLSFGHMGGKAGDSEDHSTTARSGLGEPAQLPRAGLESQIGSQVPRLSQGLVLLGATLPISTVASLHKTIKMEGLLKLKASG